VQRDCRHIHSHSHNAVKSRLTMWIRCRPTVPHAVTLASRAHITTYILALAHTHTHTHTASSGLALCSHVTAPLITFVLAWCTHTLSTGRARLSQWPEEERSGTRNFALRTSGKMGQQTLVQRRHRGTTFPCTPTSPCGAITRHHTSSHPHRAAHPHACHRTPPHPTTSTYYCHNHAFVHHRNTQHTSATAHHSHDSLTLAPHHTTRHANASQIPQQHSITIPSLASLPSSSAVVQYASVHSCITVPCHTKPPCFIVVRCNACRSTHPYTTSSRSSLFHCYAPRCALPPFSTFNYVNEIPRYTTAKMEVATGIPNNPIVQDMNKNGSLRHYAGPLCVVHPLPLLLANPGQEA
jgi:hypothetical protein